MITARRRRLRIVTLLLLGGVVLGAAAWFVYFSPYLVVRKVAVAGQQQLRAEQIVAAAQVPMGTPLALQDVDAIARRATTLPAVQAASVSRTWPHTITVTVTERRPVLAVRQEAGFALVDHEGVAYAESGSVPDGVMLAEANPMDRPLLQQVGTVAAAISGGSLGRHVSALAATNPEQISLKLKSGVTVQWGSAADSALKADIVTALLKSKRAATIDVSSPHNPAAR